MHFEKRFYNSLHHNFNLEQAMKTCSQKIFIHTGITTFNRNKTVSFCIRGTWSTQDRSTGHAYNYFYFQTVKHDQIWLRYLLFH